MSRWVYVTGIVRADTFANTDAEAMFIGQTTIDHLPRICGSERDANLHVHLEDGYNAWSTHDEFGQLSNLYTDRVHHGFESQPNILVTISGRLRDTTFDEAFRQTVATLCRMAKYIYVDECVVMVQESYGKSSIITNKGRWMDSLYEGFWDDKDKTK